MVKCSGSFEASPTFLRKCTAQFTKEEQMAEPRLVKCEAKGEMVGRSPNSLTSQKAVSERGRGPEAEGHQVPSRRGRALS